MIHIGNNGRDFHLQAGSSSYVMSVLAGKYLVHGYWGSRLRSADPTQMITLGGRHYSVVEDIDPETAAPFHGNWAAEAEGLSDRRRCIEDNRISIERLPLEYPVAGSGDLRASALGIRYADGSRTGRLEFSGHEILSGAPGPEGLPYVSALPEKCETLRIDLKDRAAVLTVSLFYLPLPGLPVILRWSRLHNGSEAPLSIEHAASASVDLPRNNADIITLDGSWSRERYFHRRPLSSGLQQVGSRGGASSHHHSPFMALADREATESTGRIWSVSLIYSGNHRHAAERDRYGSARLQSGINPADFSVHLDPGESFDTPAAVLAFSDSGLTGLSDAHHRFVRSFLIPERWRGRNRPIVANTWEAHYFDVNSFNVVELAKKAKVIGAELLVLDDGWFKNRIDDKRALGDWIPEEAKFPGGLGDAVRAVRETGMEFGLWVEPEMVSPDSELHRRHPDWILRAPGRESMLARNQLVLDLSRPEVVEYLLDLFSGVFSSAPISYVKWDMNRYMSEVGNPDLHPGEQGEVAHRYMLGLYRFWSLITERFPHILFEGCAGGGGRFDFGSLAWMPQFWTSDQTDAVERQKIQFGTSLLFPPETMGAHISAVPNHLVGRITPPETRASPPWLSTSVLNWIWPPSRRKIWPSTHGFQSCINRSGNSFAPAVSSACFPLPGTSKANRRRTGMPGRLSTKTAGKPWCSISRPWPKPMMTASGSGSGDSSPVLPTGTAPAARYSIRYSWRIRDSGCLRPPVIIAAPTGYWSKTECPKPCIFPTEPAPWPLGTLELHQEQSLDKNRRGLLNCSVL